MSKSREQLAVQVGAFVAAHRKVMRWTQAELASQIGVSRQSIFMIERGDQMPSYATLYALAAAFEVEPGSLLPEAKEVRA